MDTRLHSGSRSAPSGRRRRLADTRRLTPPPEPESTRPSLRVLPMRRPVVLDARVPPHTLRARIRAHVRFGPVA